MNFRVDYVKTQNGKVPFQEFLDSLTLEEKMEILATILEIVDYKNKNILIPSKKLKHIRKGIFELKVTHTNKITRSFLFFIKGEKIIFTNGVVKKAQKLKDKDIERSEKLRNIYLNQIKA